MSGHVRWSDIRAEHVARAGGEDAVEAGKQELLAVVVGHRLAEVRRGRPDGVTKGRVSQIEQQDLGPGRAGQVRDHARQPASPGDLFRRRKHRRDRLTDLVPVPSPG